MNNILLRRSGFLVEARGQNGLCASTIYPTVDALLRYSKRVRADWKTKQVNGGKKYVVETHKLSQLNTLNDGQKVILFPAGLTKRFVDLLTKINVKFDFQDLRNLVFPAPKLELLDHAALANRPDQLQALQAILSHDMGVISCPTAWGKTFLICQVAAVYPTIPITITSYRTDVVKSIYERVKSVVPSHQVGLRCGGKGESRRVTVCTVDSLHSTSPEKCALFIYDEVHEAASPGRSVKIQAVRNARRFGFSASPAGRSDGSNLATEAMFGPTICDITYAQAQAEGNVASIDVHLYTVTGDPIPYDDDTLRERFGIWANEPRNRLAAKLALKYELEGKQVLIITSKVEHLLRLKMLLPTWQIVHGPVDDEQITYFKNIGLLPAGDRVLCDQKSRETHRKNFERGALRTAIATGVWSQGVDFKHLDVLIRCDAMASEIPSTQIPGRLARGKYGLLVDFIDKFDDRFARRSKDRIRSYSAKGWNIEYRTPQGVITT